MKYERLTPRMLLSDAIKEYYQPKKMWRTFKYGKHDMLDLIDRLVELENKIEAGTLVEVPKGAVVLTPEERAEEMRLANEERKQAVKEFSDKVLSVSKITFGVFTDARMELSFVEYKQLIRGACGE